MKKEFLEKLQNNETYKMALNKARSEEERKKLILASESMFDALSEIFLKFEDLKSDPEKLKKVVDGLKVTNHSEG